MALFGLGLIIGWLVGAVMIGLELQRSEISLRKGGRHRG